MRTLFVTPVLPLKTGSGRSIRSFQLYEQLKCFSTVDVITSNPTGVKFSAAKKFSQCERYLGHIQCRWQEKIEENSAPINQYLADVIDSSDYDYIFVRYYIVAQSLGILGAHNLILDCDDCQLELAHQAIISKSFLNLKKYMDLYRFERQRCVYVKNLEKLDAVIFSKATSRISWQENFHLLQNKIFFEEDPIGDASFSERENISILFVGVLSYYPNYKGMDRFLNNVWPRVIVAFPDIVLDVIGAGLPAIYKRKWSDIQGVNLRGYVENLEDVYKNCDFSIVPTYEGSGTHIKIIESLAHQRTLVVSTQAHRGYETTLPDGECLYVADSDEDFFHKIQCLCQNQKKRAELANHGYKQVRENYRLNGSGIDLETIVDAIEKKKVPVSVPDEKNRMPFLSIVIPTHNRPERLANALRSVLVQEYRNFEILVVDDGSHVSYESILSIFVGDIRYFKHSAPEGASEARNTGIKAAEGQWIVFLDDDDELAPGFLNSVAKLIDKSSDNFDFLWSNVRYDHYENDTFKYSSFKIFNKNYKEIRDLYADVLSIGIGCGIVVKKSCFSEVGLFDTSFRVCEDIEFFVRLLSRGYRPKHLESLGVIVHQHNDDRLSAYYSNYSDALVYEQILTKYKSFFREHLYNYMCLLTWSTEVHYRARNYSVGDRCLRKVIWGCLFQPSFVFRYIELRNIRASTSIMRT